MLGAPINNYLLFILTDDVEYDRLPIKKIGSMVRTLLF